MGLGDFFQKAWNWSSTAAKNTISSVKDAAQSVWEGTKKVAAKAAEVTSNTVQTVYTDVIKTPISVVSNGLQGFSSLLSNPLIYLVAGVAAIAIIPPLINGAARIRP